METAYFFYRCHITSVELGNMPRHWILLLIHTSSTITLLCIINGRAKVECPRCHNTKLFALNNLVSYNMRIIYRNIFRNQG